MLDPVAAERAEAEIDAFVARQAREEAEAAVEKTASKWEGGGG